MNNPLRPLIKLIDRWAAQRVVRVALFGHGLALAEWESLMTTPYLRATPRVQLVAHPSEAEVLAIHGPFNSLNWKALEAWVASGKESARVIAVGKELQLSDEGYVVGPENELSSFRISSHLTGHPPTPQDIQQALECLMQVTHV